MSKVSEIIYFNATISNSTSYEPIQATFTMNSNQPILQDQSKYYGSIIRVNINQYLVPILYFKIQTPVNNINLGIYSFTLTYNNFKSPQTFLNLVSSNTAITQPITGTPHQVNSLYYYIYSYQTIVDMMNVALLSAYNNLSAQVGDDLLNLLDYPYILFNNNLQQFELHTGGIFDQNIVDNVKIFCNSTLAPFLHGFKIIISSYTDINGLNYLLSVKSLPDINKKLNVDSGTGYITMYQEASCLSYINSLRNVYITSSLPVQKEAFYSTATNTEFINVLTDYVPDLSGVEESLLVEKQFIYNASSLYRLFEFSESSQILNRIDLSIYWADNDGQLYPLYIYYGMKSDIKIMFIRKDLVRF